MRVLVLTAKAIWPLLGGAEIRNFSLLKETSKHHEVYLLSFLLGPNDRDNFGGLEPYCKKIVGIELVRPRWSRAARAARSVLGGDRPFIIDDYHRREMAETLTRMVREEKIDVIHAHFLHVGQYAEHKGRAAFVYDAHNLEHVLWQRFAEVQHSPLLRSFARVQIPKFVRWQQRVAAQSEKIVTLSDGDREEFLRIAPAADVTTVSNGADIDFFHPLADIAVEEQSIVYFANFGWPPQDDAALFFHDDILPIVRKSFPNVKLYLAGKTPPEAIQRLASDHVVVTGYVPDIREYIQRAAVVVLPLRVGAGTKHRVFQSLAMEKPLVTTSVGAEGIALEHGHTAMITDDPVAFAEHTVALLQDPARRAAMGRAGRELVVARYDWRANYQKLDTVFQEAVARRR
ncbi:MAG TPA: glycosyltransferase family 4 protein [Candidatus Krumholzibacteria bacterium]|nr:glycosyltransferase family 4 protein [Candidatus Krumholzibacteria bacterium]